MKKQQQKPAKALKKRQHAKKKQSAASNVTIPTREEDIAFELQCQEKLRKSLHHSLIEELQDFSPDEPLRLRHVFVDQIDILPVLKKMNTWSIPIIESFIEIHGMFCETGDGRVSILVNIFDRLNSHPSEPLVKDKLIRSFYKGTRNTEDNYDEFG